MTRTFRAALALGLLAGFYLLVGLVIATAVVLDIMIIQRGGQALQAGVAVTLVAIALIRALIVVSRRRPGGEPGVAVTPHDEPALWQTVHQLAQQVQTRPPDEIRLVPEVNAAVSEDTKLLGLRASRRRMYIGVPLLMALTADEMRAVLGHELGHYSGSHTRLGAPVYRGRVALAATLQALENHPFVRRIFIWYAKLFFRVSQAVSRRQELEADQLAVAIAGRSAAAGALRKVHGVAPAWDFFRNSYLGLIGPARTRPADVFGGFHALISDPVRQRQIAEAIAEPGDRSPYDSHPSLPERLAAIDRLPEPVLMPDPRSAMLLLRDPSLAAQAVQESLWTDQARQLPTGSWDDLVARGMYAAVNQEAVKDLAVAGQRVMGVPEPYLDAAFEALARGHLAAVRQQLVSLGWNDGERLVDQVLARALAGAMIEHRLARWTLSWSSPARLLDNAGQEVKLDDFAAAVVADPARQVPVLRDWLARSGIRADYRPQVALASPPAPVG